VFVGVLPVFLFSGFIIDRLVEAQRRESEDLLTRTANELILAFDQEINSTIRTLEAMAQSEHLRRNDLKTYHGIASRILKTQPTWKNILILNTNGERLVSARFKYGQDIGKAIEPVSLAELLKTDQPTIGNIAFSKNQQDPAFAVRVPVHDDQGKIKLVLTAVISLKSTQELVTRFSTVPGEWVRALVDRNGTLGARSRTPEKFLGQSSSETLRKLIEKKFEGIDKTETLEKVRAYTSVARSKISGWSAAIAVPQDVLIAEAENTQWTSLFISLAMLFFSSIAAFYIATRLTRSIRAGSDGAAMLAKGLTPEIPSSPITEVEELRTSLLSASKLLQSRDKAKGEFLANMSHELRTPLGIILGMTDLLSKEAVPAEEQSRIWEIVQRNGQQLLRLINDILDFSKIEAERLVIEKINFNLRDLVADVTEDFSAMASIKEISLKLEIDKNVPEIVTSDPVRVRQVISNLIDNALKFTNKGYVETKVTCVDSQNIKITVKDTGIGLDEKQQGRLFKDFTQGDSSHTRKYGGTGLGLSLSRKLARLLKGDVRLVRSFPHEGSEFEFIFNIGVAESASEGPACASVTDKKPLRFRKGAKILLAEDSPDIASLVKLYLKPTGIEIDIATDGAIAVELAKVGSYDLILMDIQMPKMDGYEATGIIRAMGMKTPIIALTAHALDEHRNRAMATGFSAFLTKPIKKNELLEVLAGYHQLT
jgi:signal transduction histidine kinase/CheY-like chemotaxis protein